MKLKHISKTGGNEHLVLVGRKGSDYSQFIQDKDQLAYLQSRLEDDQNEVVINQYKRFVIVCQTEYKDKKGDPLEKVRLSGQIIQSFANNRKIEQLNILDLCNDQDQVVALAEGMVLGSYQFLKYKKEQKEKSNSLHTLTFSGNSLSRQKARELQHILEGVALARDLVNEPLSYLTAEQLSAEITAAGRKAGFSVEVFHKKKIESLRMGGLLAVNKGSIDPPTFSILEWKPGNARNRQPVVLVGKGIVYDTGGLSLKPTHDSMDYMKSDMAGAAAVAGALYAASMNKLPVHLIGLIPATDNRPDGNAYVPGDVISMYDDTTVEVLNTDAEGRMILADALSWAKKYNPQLVINLATLTGSAHAALGKYGIVGMGNAGKKIFEALRNCGDKVFERVAEFPFWDDYSELLKSDIADLKNIGGRYAGAITAGKFLEHFTDYPFIHLDIAGPSFNKTPDAYRGRGGSGIGVRLLHEFIKTQVK